MDVYPKLQFVTLKEQTDRRTDRHPYSINIDRYNMGLGLRPSIDTLHYITLHKSPYWPPPLFVTLSIHYFMYHYSFHPFPAKYKHPFSLKIALFWILANFDVIFRGEGVEIEKIWLNFDLKRSSRAVQISAQIFRSCRRFWDIAR